jgi:hypothetical protein
MADRIMAGQDHAEQRPNHCWQDHKRRGRMILPLMILPNMILSGHDSVFSIWLRLCRAVLYRGIVFRKYKVAPRLGTATVRRRLLEGLRVTCSRFSNNLDTATQV